MRPALISSRMIRSLIDVSRAASFGLTPIAWDCVDWCGFMGMNLAHRSATSRLRHQKVSAEAYFLDSHTYQAGMSTSPSVDTLAVRETQWERLYRLVELRRDRLDLTQAGIQAIGGPSPAWLRKLPNMVGEPTSRMRSTLTDLDRALQWDVGTSWGLVAHDRSAWSEEVLEDEEHSLVELGPDDCDHFGYVVAARLRAIPEGRERDSAMRQVLSALDIRP